MGGTRKAMRLSALVMLLTLSASGCRYFSWGANTHGQLADGTTTGRATPVAMPPAAPWSMIEPGSEFGCGIRSTDQLWCWGEDDFGQVGDGTTTGVLRNLPVQVTAIATGWSTVSAGGEHACAITTGTQLWCWGAGSRGQLGDGSNNQTSVPLLVSLLTGWSSVTNGNLHSCALRAGELWCWGANSEGQLGDGQTGNGTTAADRNVPTRVGTASDWTSVHAGESSTCGIRAGGQAWCWGQNVAGELGDGTTTNRVVPTRVGTGTDWLSLGGGGEFHTCGIRTAGQVWCWGANSAGQLGDGTTSNRLVPTRVGTGTNWNTVTTGQDHTCGTRAGGQLYCWGDNSVNQLGTGLLQSMSAVPLRVGAGTDWTVAAGREETCGLRTHGDFFCWGIAVPDGTGSTRDTPVEAGVPNNWTTISASGDHTCGINVDEALWCWGDNSKGEVGDGTTIDRATPVRIGNADDWTDITTGTFHTCGIEQDAFLFCWGWNLTGQLGDGTTTDRSTPTYIPTPNFTNSVSAGHDHTCATQTPTLPATTGTLWCWGYNFYGQLGDGTTTERHVPVQVGTDGDWSGETTGSFHTCAIKAGGQLWCWGYNFEGELGLGFGGSGTHQHTPQRVGSASNWTTVTAGGNHTCAIAASTLSCWGLNASGQAGDATNSDRYSPTPVGSNTDWSTVSAGLAHTCGIRSGQLWCWGENGSSQLGDGTTTDRNLPTRIGTNADWSNVDAGGDFTVASRSGA